MKQDSASAYHPVVFTILSASSAAVHYCGAAGMKECSASAYQCSSARHSVVRQSISAQWRANSNGGGHCLCLFGQQCRAWHSCGPNTSVSAQQPAALAIPSASSVSQSTMRMEEDIVLTHHPAVFVSLSVQPFACTMADLLEWKRTLPLPNT